MAEKYDNPTKQTWRGWAWNQLGGRLAPGSRVMVLCGEHGRADIDHANRRGFECVGIDVSRECVDAFRSANGVAVLDKLHRQMLLIQPDGVILDMLGGMTRQSMIDPLWCSLVAKAIVWNGLRGRDPLVSHVAQHAGQTVSDYTSGGRGTIRSVRGNHRGKIAWVQFVTNLHVSLNPSTQRKDGDAVHVPSEFEAMIGKASRPAYYSYRSKDSGVYFDSCAFTNPAVIRSGDWLASPEPGAVSRVAQSKRKAAAAKALLTMRRNRN